MYPIVTFPLLTIIGDKDAVVKTEGDHATFRALSPKSGTYTAMHVFNAFGLNETIKQQQIGYGSIVTLTAEMCHYKDRQDRERDSFSIISISKLGVRQNADGVKEVSGLPIVTFQAVKILSIQRKTAKNGALYMTLKAEEVATHHGMHPVRIFTAWEKQLQSLDRMSLKEGAVVTIVAEMRSYLEENVQKMSYRILSIGYINTGRDHAAKAPAEDVKPASGFDEEIPEAIEQTIPEKQESVEPGDVQTRRAIPESKIPEFDPEEFSTLFA